MSVVMGRHELTETYKGSGEKSNGCDEGTSALAVSYDPFALGIWNGAMLSFSGSAVGLKENRTCHMKET